MRIVASTLAVLFVSWLGFLAETFMEYQGVDFYFIKQAAFFRGALCVMAVFVTMHITEPRNARLKAKE